MNFRSGSVVLPPPVEAEGWSFADATAGCPFTIDPPTAPNTTTSATVTPATIAANLVAGRSLTLTAGNYPDVSISVDDIELILEAGANLTGTTSIFVGANRVMIRGENHLDGEIDHLFVQGGVTDWCVKETTFASSDTDDNHVEGTRGAIMSCYMRMSGWIVYSDDSAPPLTHFIFSNNDAEGLSGSSGHCLRFINSSQTCVTNNRLVHDGASAYRLHADNADSTEHYCARNQFGAGNSVFINADGDANAIYSRLIEVWFEDNDFYPNFDIAGSFDLGSGGARPEILHMTGNRWYGTGSWPAEALPAWDISGNTVSPYTPPPAWSFNGF
jgi:hypothetical protein